MEMVCNISDVPLDTMKGFNVKDNYVLVANVDDNFHVVDAVCPHMSGFIPVGKLENNFIISCPTHGAQYDVSTGKFIKDVDDEIKVATGSGASDLQTCKVCNPIL